MWANCYIPLDHSIKILEWFQAHIKSVRLSLSFKGLLIYLKTKVREREGGRDRKREREGEEREKKRENLLSLILSPNGRSSQSCATLRPGAWNTIWVSHVGGRRLDSWSISCCLSRYISQELDWRWSVQGLNWCSDMRCRHHKLRLNLWGSTLAPSLSF